ncbi:glycerol-3-phosphate acyltransferase 4-like [Planococcus citri]|uniref:glycerol-3-phosphate acyltransferase 4-like n=1 Tax=Planococcus citri TaxID=170843 RepID=UPI0031F947AF
MITFWEFLGYLYVLLRWYLYLYWWYFLLIVILSIFKVHLGVHRGIVVVMSQIFKYIDQSRKKIVPDIEDDEDQAIECGPIISPEVDSKMYSATILQNGKIPRFSSAIQRDIILLPELQHELDLDDDQEIRFTECPNSTYDLSDAIPYIKAGIEAIVEDQITSRFEAEELRTWNLLTRKNPRLCIYNDWKIAVMWFIGAVIRYSILFPVRFVNCFTSIGLLIAGMAVVGYVPESRFKKLLYKRVNIMCFHVMARWLGCFLTFHNRENRPTGGIAVSNHTTPFDVLMLNTDHCYSLTGQRQGGIIGVLERALSRASPHIWFERAVTSDRGAVARRLRDHVSNPKNPPILIFPEGTCINNTAVTQFKKGAFEVGATVFPIALKYNALYGDPFWNSSKQSGFQHVIEMMTSWAIKCDIYYLPPMERKPDETSIQFANRVKAVIANKMKVVNLSWDGGVKRSKPKPEWKALHQKLFSHKLKTRVRNIDQ